MKINLLPFIAEALSTNKKIYNEIDKIYNEDKFHYMKLAKENEFYNHIMSQEGDIQQEYYFKKALGILQSTDPNISERLFLIFKNGWKCAYTFVQNYNNIIVSVFLHKFTKKNKDIDNLSDELNSNLIVLLLLSSYFEKEIDTEDKMYKTYIDSCISRLENYKHINRINLNTLTKEEKGLIRKLELKLKAHNKISTTTPSSYRLDENKNNELIIDINKLTNEDKSLLPFEYIGDLENLSIISIVGKDFFQQKDIRELIYLYSQFQTEDTIDYKDFFKYIYPAIQIRYLCRQYKKAKKYFFENFDGGLFEKINKKQVENKEIKKSNLLLQNENERLKLELEKIKKENNKLKQELATRENYKSEIVPLREFLFTLDNVDDINDSQIDYTKLKLLNAVIIGGHIQWQNKIKKYLSNCRFISPNTLNFDTNILNNADIVFIYANYLNHAIYYKVIDIIREKEIRLEYLKSNTNIEIILSQINRVL